MESAPGEALASKIACRNDPAPALLVLVTVNVVAIAEFAKTPVNNIIIKNDKSLFIPTVDWLLTVLYILLFILTSITNTICLIIAASNLYILFFNFPLINIDAYTLTYRGDNTIIRRTPN